MKSLVEEFELNRLARKMKQGDGSAAEKLYGKLADKTYGFCMNRVGNPQVAEDLMQDIFLKVVERIETFERGKGSFISWFWQLARNTVTDHYRKKRESAFADVNEEKMDRDTAYDPMERLTRKWEYERVSRFMQSLEKDEQELFELRFVVDLSYKEIASALGKSEGSLRVATNRLKNKIRNSLA